MPQTPSQTDVYTTALDIFDKTHPLRVDVDENLKVVLANDPTIDIGKVDQGAAGTDPWPVIITAYTLADNHWLTNIPSSITPVIILPAAIGRKQVVINNDSKAFLYIKFGSGLTTTYYDVKIPPQGYYESPPYLLAGDWYGMWSSVDGFAMVSSLY